MYPSENTEGKDICDLASKIFFEVTNQFTVATSIVLFANFSFPFLTQISPNLL